MRVQYEWRDSADYPYNVHAEVGLTGRNNIQIVKVLTHDGIELDFHDDDNFTDEERRTILWLAKEAGDELESSEDPLDDDELDEDDDESNIDRY